MQITHHTIVAGLSIGLLLAAAESGAVVRIDSDTLISDPIEDSVVVEAGPDGPPNVRIVAGGSVDGLTAINGSRVDLDGGAITFPPRFFDSATFVMHSGVVDCSAERCAAADIPYNLYGGSSSTVELYGGRVGAGIDFGPLPFASGSILLEQDAILKIYGTDLSISLLLPSSEQLIRGRFASGEPVSLRVNPRQNASIQLITVPEPTAGVLCGLGVLAGVLRHSRS